MTSDTLQVTDTGVDLSHPDLVSSLWTNPGEIPGNGIDDDGNGWVE
jgi:subtilisin family serine protease